MTIFLSDYSLGYGGQAIRLDVLPTHHAVGVRVSGSHNGNAESQFRVPMEALPALIREMQGIVRQHLYGHDLLTDHVFGGFNNGDIAAALELAREFEIDFEGKSSLPGQLSPEQMRAVHGLLSNAYDGGLGDLVEAVREVANPPEVVPCWEC